METTLKFAKVCADLTSFFSLIREERDVLDRAALGYLGPDRPTIKTIDEQVGIATEARSRRRAAQELTPLAVPSEATARRTVRSIDPFRVLRARQGADVARSPFRLLVNPLDLTHPSEWVEFDDWAEAINACLAATGLIAPKARNAMSAARLSVTVTTCRETRMILALEAPSDDHAKFDPKSPDKANPEGRRAPVPAGAEGILNVPELIKTDDDNAFFATATFNQFFNQEAV